MFKSRGASVAFRTRKKLLLDLENRAWRVSITFVSCSANNSVYTAIQKYEASNMFALSQLLEFPLPFKTQNSSLENNYFSMDVLGYRDTHQKTEVHTDTQKDCFSC